MHILENMTNYIQSENISNYLSLIGINVDNLRNDLTVEFVIEIEQFLNILYQDANCSDAGYPNINHLEQLVLLIKNSK